MTPDLSRDALRIQFKQKLQEQILEIVRRQQLGHTLAQRKLNCTPMYLDVDRVVIQQRVRQTGIILADIDFLTDEGEFRSRLALKELSSTNETDYVVQIHRWLMQRLFNNPTVHVLDILHANGNTILFEGVEGDLFADSQLGQDLKLGLTSEALLSFQGFECRPVDPYRYGGLLEKLIQALPISADRKSRLMSLGYSLFAYHDSRNSGVYSFGGFHPWNLVLDHQGLNIYFVSPELVETNSMSDRFEDIANFFIFYATEEFRTQGTVKQTFKIVYTFLQAYNNVLNMNGLSLEEMYNQTHWIALFFHLGLTALMRGALATGSIAEGDTTAIQKGMDKVAMSYQLAKELWLLGVKSIPATAYPKVGPGKVLSQEGYFITWAWLSYRLREVLAYHPTFKLLFNFPSTKDNVASDHALQYWGFEKRKELEQTNKTLESWLEEEVLKVSGREIVLLPSSKQYLNQSDDKLFPEKVRSLVLLLYKDPVFQILFLVNREKELSYQLLESYSGMTEKELAPLVTKLVKDRVLEKSGSFFRLSQEWRLNMRLPEDFDFNLFSELF